MRVLVITYIVYSLIYFQSKEELEELLSSDVVFDAFFEQLEQVRNMMILQDEMRMQNELLASMRHLFLYEKKSKQLYNHFLFLIMSDLIYKNIISQRENFIT